MFVVISTDKFDKWVSYQRLCSKQSPPFSVDLILDFESISSGWTNCLILFCLLEVTLDFNVTLHRHVEQAKHALISYKLIIKPNREWQSNHLTQMLIEAVKNPLKPLQYLRRCELFQDVRMILFVTNNAIGWMSQYFVLSPKTQANICSKYFLLAISQHLLLGKPFFRRKILFET